MPPSSSGPREAAQAGIAEARHDDAARPDDLLERIGVVVAGLQELTGLLNEALARSDATHLKSNSDLVVLTCAYLDGPQRPRDLLEPTGLTSGGMANLVDRLETVGVLERRRGVAHDKRSVLIALTADGRAVLEQIAGSIRGTFALAAPTLERWRQEFVSMGLSVGPSPHPAGSTRFQLERIRRAAAAGRSFWPIYGEVLGSEDPTPNHTAHLLLLADRPGGIRPRAISAATRLSPASTTELVDRVERRGLIARLAGIEDRRAVIVITTPSGHAALESLLASTAPLMQQFATALFPT